MIGFHPALVLSNMTLSDFQRRNYFNTEELGGSGMEVVKP